MCPWAEKFKSSGVDKVPSGVELREKKRRGMKYNIYSFTVKQNEVIEHKLRVNLIRDLKK